MYSALRDDVVWIRTGEACAFEKIHNIGFTVVRQCVVQVWYLAFLRSSEYSSFFSPIVRRKMTSSLPVYELVPKVILKYRKSSIDIVKHDLHIRTHYCSSWTFLQHQTVLCSIIYMKQLLSLFATQVSIRIAEDKSNRYASISQINSEPYRRRNYFSLNHFVQLLKVSLHAGIRVAYLRRYVADWKGRFWFDLCMT